LIGEILNASVTLERAVEMAATLPSPLLDSERDTAGEALRSIAQHGAELNALLFSSSRSDVVDAEVIA
jgi:hypothetical protein